MGQQPHVVGELAGGLGDGRQGGDHAGIHLPGVGLAGHGDHPIKTHLLGDHLLQLFDLLVVPVEELQEAGLGAGGALAAQELQGAHTEFQFLQVHEQLVDPEGGPLAHGGELGRLIVGEAQGGLGLVFRRELRQDLDDVHQALPDQLQALPHEDHVGVVAHIAAGGAQVDDGHGLRALGAVGMDVRHHVMAQALLLGLGHIVVDIVLVGLQLIDLRLGHRQAQLHLRPGQGDPEPAPGGEFFVLREQIEHLRAGVAAGKGALIN